MYFDEENDFWPDGLTRSPPLFEGFYFVCLFPECKQAFNIWGYLVKIYIIGLQTNVIRILVPTFE